MTEQKIEKITLVNLVSTVLTSIRLKCAFAYLVLSLLGFATLSFAQQSSLGTSSANKADKNLKGNSRVNPSTLAMEFSLPLGVYPGRNGNSMPITFNYSSKLWETYVVDNRQDDSVVAGHRIIEDFSKARLYFSQNSASGWSSSLHPPRIVKSDNIFFAIGEGPVNSYGVLDITNEASQGIEKLLKTSPETQGISCFNLIITDTGEFCTECEDWDPATGNLRIWLECITIGGGGGPPRQLPPPRPVRFEFVVKRIKVLMPDGSTVEFRKSDKVYNCLQEQCFTDMDGTYLAVNGSKMRFERNELQSDNQRRDVLYLPDGSRYLFPVAIPNSLSPRFEAEQYIDVDGNKMLYNATERKWTDTLGRNFINPLSTLVINPPALNPPLAEGTQTLYLPGMGTQTQQYQLVWKKLKRPECVASTDPNCGETILEDPTQELYYRGSDSCQNWLDNPIQPALFAGTSYSTTDNGITRNIKRMLCASEVYGVVARFNPVVLSQVILPNGKSYTFKYNRYGEITRINYPTGGYEKFRYDEIYPIGYQMDPEYNKTNRGVVERWVSDGTNIIQHWEYQAEGVVVNSLSRYLVTTNAPDGTKTKRYMYRSFSSEYGFEHSYSGMPFEERFYDSNNNLKGRKLTEWTHNGPLPDGYETATRDPKPVREISITIEGDKALATMSETEYDSNADITYFAHLNPKRTKSYHYISLTMTQATDWDITQLKEEFTQRGQVANIGETDYLYDANYKSRGLLTLPTETRVIDPSNNQVIAKTQSVYDEQGDYSIIDYGTATGYVAPTGSYAHLRGNVTTARVWNSTTNSWIETHARYDNFGNLRQAWDANGNMSETVFSPDYQYAYPTKVITPAPDPNNTGHGTTEGSEVTTSYDFNTGLPLSVTNLNDLQNPNDDVTATTEYNDPLLRPTRVNPPVGGNGSITETIYNDTVGALSVKTRTQVDAVNWVESTTFMDGLGRNYKTQAKDSQGDVFTEVQYDNMGRITKTSNPYRDGEEKQWIETVYDEAGRVKEVISPKIANEAIPAKIKSEYSLSTTGNEIGIVIVGINQAGKKGRSITNALGQIIRVDELNDAGDLGPIDNPTQPTYYKYNPQGQMVQVTQGNQNRYFLYDNLGRLIRLKQPEQDANPDLTLYDLITGNSQWSSAMSYDNNGNVLTSTDPKGVIINYAYDNANRVIQRSYLIPQTSDPKKITYSTSTVNFKYDGLLSPAPNNPNPTIVQYAKGTLTEISNGVSTTQNTGFDNLGRILSSQQITDGQVYPFTYKYDNISGVLLEEKYPSGRIVKNIYNNDSDLAAVSTRLPNESPRFRAGNFRYTSKGDVDQIQLGNGRWETYKYNTRNQVTERALGTSPTDTSLWKVNYDYGRVNTDGTIDVAKNDGNIIRQTITVSGMANSFVQTYSYDSINRLIEAVETNGGQQTWRQTFGYDRYGNRINFSQIIGQTQLELNNITHPTIDPLNNRFTAGQGYEYDFNGNLIQDAEGRKYSFDGDNKQREVKNSNNQTIATYSYDGSGRRIKKTVVSTQETTVFVYDAGGKLTGEYSTTQPQNSGTTKYLMNDSLNTPRAITDQNGNVISRRDFLPFGEEIQVNTANRTADFKYGVADNVRQKFTGYQRDDETQLDFAEARYYNGKHGRFTAVDPLLASGKSMNPQTFNRYVYAGNSPTRRTDPNGQDWYTDDKFEIRNGVKVWVSRTYKWFNAPNMWIFGYGRVTNFLVNYNSGPALGLHVLNPWEGFQAKVSSESEAKAKIDQWRKEAFLDFVVGALEAASFILEISGALDGTGVYRGSSYNLGYNSSTLVTSLKLLTGVGALDKALSVGAKMFGKDLLPLLKGAIKVCCFVAGTPIHTDKGLVPIEEIKVGDKVLSYNEKTKRFEYKQVAQTFTGTKENLVHLKIKGEKKSLTTTTEHPFYVKKTHKARDSLSSGDDDNADEEGEWVEAGTLKIGDKVLRSNGKWTRITRIEYETKQITVYNFEVEGNHSYFVGELGVLSHNCDWSAIRLAGETGREMLGDALRKLKVSGGSAEELAKGFQSFADQIAERTKNSWTATRQASSDGSFIWTGDAIGRAFVIGPDGKMYLGLITDANQFSIGRGGVITPNYSNLRPIE